MQLARRRPFRLKDRFASAAGDANRIGHRAVPLNDGHPKLGPVPGHIRMIPLKPGQTRTFRIQPRRRIEIRAAGEPDLRARPAQRYPDDRVDRFASRRRMILAHADHPVTPAVNHAVGVTHFSFRRYSLRLSGAVEAIHSLVGEVREIDCAVAYGKTAAAVFVDARASVERRRREVSRFTIRLKFNNQLAAFLSRPGLNPVDVGAMNSDLTQTDSPGDDQIRSDLRFPGTVARDLRFRHRSFTPKFVCSSPFSRQVALT